MNIDAANKIMDGYARWWRDSVQICQEGEAVRIVCPMLDRHNDHMSIYLADDATGGYVLTDMGATIEDLAMSGCDVLASGARKDKLDELVMGFGLKREKGELYKETSEAGLYQSINMLMQGMATVDDLFFTARENIRSFFLDDVKTWFDVHKIRYMPNVRISGRSGFEVKFDFAIPKTQGKAPERLIKAVGSPSESSVANALFGLSDIREARRDMQGYLFMNAVSASGETQPLDPALVSACLNYDVLPVAWTGSADSVLADLAA